MNLSRNKSSSYPPKAEWEPLQTMLLQVFQGLQPNSSEKSKRDDILRRVNTVAASLHSYKGYEVVPFGSFASNLFTPTSDLDLSIQLPISGAIGVRPSSSGVQILNDFFRALKHTGMAHDIEFIRSARVPVISFKDNATDVSCDITVENDGACVKSCVLRMISEMDERCRQLIFLVKCWAKANGINSPKLGTLNSYALSLLAIFHLQTCDPPILPPLQEIIGSAGGMPVGFWRDRPNREAYYEICRSNIQRLQATGYCRHNSSSLAELFASFFCQIASKGLERSQSVRTLTGDLGGRTGFYDSYEIIIADPFNESQNSARSVQDYSVSTVRQVFKKAATSLTSPPTRDQIGHLQTALFEEQTNAALSAHHLGTRLRDFLF